MNTIAERRMISKRVMNSARFVRMPPSTRALYAQLVVNADDDGVVEAYTVMSMVNATEDDLHVLVAKKFATVLNDDLVTYLNDWPENNSIRADRKIDSIYKNLLLRVLPDLNLVEAKDRSDTKSPRQIKPKGVDGPLAVHGQPMDGIGKVRLGKVSVGKDSTSKEKNHSPAKAEPPINYAGVFEYLNKKSGKHFRNTDTSRKLIKARLEEGFTPQDVQRAIDNVCQGWLGTEMAQYIRPSTIFRASKFEGYVNAVPRVMRQAGSRQENTPDWLREKMVAENQTEPVSKPKPPESVSPETQQEIEEGLEALKQLRKKKAGE